MFSKRVVNLFLRIIKHIPLPIFTIVFLLLLWYFIYGLKLLSPLVMPSPGQVISAFVVWSKSNLLMDLVTTILIRLFISFGLGIVGGLLLGIIIAITPLLRGLIVPVIEMLRSIPAIALFPLFTVAFGIGETARIASATFSIIFLVSLYTFQGITTIHQPLVLMTQTIAKNSNKVRVWMLKEIYLPGALPTILFGLRLSLPIALVIIVATEMLFGTTYGLGSRIILSQLAYRIPNAWAAIIVTALLGYGLNKLLRMIEDKYSFWVGH
jgi:NitT/TauT family transport system permease protein